MELAAEIAYRTPFVVAATPVGAGHNRWTEAARIGSEDQFFAVAIGDLLPVVADLEAESKARYVAVTKVEIACQSVGTAVATEVANPSAGIAAVAVAEVVGSTESGVAGKECCRIPFLEFAKAAGLENWWKIHKETSWLACYQNLYQHSVHYRNYPLSEPY